MKRQPFIVVKHVTGFESKTLYRTGDPGRQFSMDIDKAYVHGAHRYESISGQLRAMNKSETGRHWYEIQFPLDKGEMNMLIYELSKI